VYCHQETLVVLTSSFQDFKITIPVALFDPFPSLGFKPKPQALQLWHQNQQVHQQN
jgi:hypothetical protein